MLDPLMQMLIVIPLAVLFIGASQHKRSDAARVQAQLSAYKVLPKSLTPVFGKLLPLAELCTGLALLVPLTRPLAAIVAVSLLCIYAFAILFNVLRGQIDIDCGCGGPAQPLSYWLVLRNAMLAGAAALLTLPTMERVLGVADVLVLILLTALFSVCYLTISQLLHNRAALGGWHSHEH